MITPDYAIPDNPTDPEPAALELIVRMPQEICTETTSPKRCRITAQCFTPREHLPASRGPMQSRSPLRWRLISSLAMMRRSSSPSAHGMSSAVTTAWCGTTEKAWYERSTSQQRCYHCEKRRKRSERRHAGGDMSAVLHLVRDGDGSDGVLPPLDAWEICMRALAGLSGRSAMAGCGWSSWNARAARRLRRWRLWKFRGSWGDRR